MTGLFGVYIHVPFCAARCDYCAFATWTDQDALMTAYVEACVRELAEADLPPAASVFVGGGTPSRLDAELLARLLRAVATAPGAEVTAECNPEDASGPMLESWRNAGVTRVSFGVQSMVPHVLDALGRRHRPGAVTAAAARVKAAGFESWNVDLIYGATGETAADWERTLDEVLALDPPHVSAYALTVEPGTPLAGDSCRHPDDDDQAAKYLVADERLRTAGLDWYEISNWARPGYECRHNRLYWAQGDYRGIGCAAHSHDGGRRWWNVRTPARYIERITAGSSPVAGEEVLAARARARERVELGLRTREGVPADAVDAAGIDGEDGLVAVRGERVVLTRRGRLLANEVASRTRS
jgi:putative oxygen-independent coproporphyrinogen III oxidase